MGNERKIMTFESTGERQLLGSEINYVKLHGSDAFVPGIGGIGTTLPPQAKALDMKMYHEVDGLYVEVNKPVRRAFLVPWANIQLAVYSGK